MASEITSLFTVALLMYTDLGACVSCIKIIHILSARCWMVSSVSMIYNYSRFKKLY